MLQAKNGIEEHVYKWHSLKHFVLIFGVQCIFQNDICSLCLVYVFKCAMVTSCIDITVKHQLSVICGVMTCLVYIVYADGLTGINNSHVEDGLNTCTVLNLSHCVISAALKCE